MKIGDQPASEKTYREELIGQALAGMPTALSVGIAADVAIQRADAVLKLLEKREKEQADGKPEV